MIKKDSYWFRHDSTAGRALKMRKMAHIYGHWGKGIYWDVCEILRDNENYSFESDESSLQMLSDLIGCKDDNKFISWYNDCIKYELLKEEDNYFFSPALSESMKKWDSSKANGSKGGRPKKTESITQIKPKDNPNDNPTETITEQNRTEDNIEFDVFWDLYNKKTDRTNCEKKWKSLKDSERETIIEVLPKYIKSTPDVKFRKNPKTWLNGKCWNDEIESFIVKPSKPVEEMTEQERGEHLKLILKNS